MVTCIYGICACISMGTGLDKVSIVDVCSICRCIDGGCGGGEVGCLLWVWISGNGNGMPWGYWGYRGQSAVRAVIHSCNKCLMDQLTLIVLIDIYMQVHSTPCL